LEGGAGSLHRSSMRTTAAILLAECVMFTTRIGIGFSGSLYNCSTKREAFQVDVVDVNPDPYCAVNVPHFIAAKNTAPGMTQYWSANSTLVNCMNTTHTFTVTLRDTNSGTVLATTTVSAFL
jgi:hypothetical protein